MRGRRALAARASPVARGPEAARARGGEGAIDAHHDPGPFGPRLDLRPSGSTTRTTGLGIALECLERRSPPRPQGAYTQLNHTTPLSHGVSRGVGNPPTPHCASSTSSQSSEPSPLSPGGAISSEPAFVSVLPLTSE